MKEILSLFTILIIPVAVSAQDYNQIITDPSINREILYGYCTRDTFDTEPFSEWFSTEYENYPVDESLLGELNQEQVHQYTVKIVLGTWCPDSQREVPRFFKILDYLKFDERKITLISVDRRKKADGTEVEDLMIDFVPTFIFYVEGREAGRIIETPEVSLEADMIKILNHEE